MDASVPNFSIVVLRASPGSGLTINTHLRPTLCENAPYVEVSKTVASENNRARGLDIATQQLSPWSVYKSVRQVRSFGQDECGV